MDYRRIWHRGGTYFFTVNLLDRTDDLLTRHIDLLRRSIRIVKSRHPFKIHAWSVLPEHMHCVLELPEGDSDFATRWRLIKINFSKGLPVLESRSAIRIARGERGIWQRRYWEHLIRDDDDFRAHIDYVHINPVKHGLAKRASDWPYSTIHKYIALGVYGPGWADSDNRVDYDD
ncbi:MAG TPA: transposase [Spongiibacteraceae bacterium]|nr:transposase [Spongiibacteraceae bacterium]